MRGSPHLVTEAGDGMAATSMLSILQENRLFGGLSGDVLERIAGLATRRKAPAGRVLFVQGETGDLFFGIESGRVRMSASSPEGREIHFVELGPRDTFGEIALLDGGPRTATATVAAAASLVVIDRASFRALLEREPGLGLRLLERLCERVRWTTELVEDLSLLSVDAQIANRIRLLAENFGVDRQEGRALAITQSDLAAFLGMSRQSINVHLHRWRDEGWLDTSRGQLLIRDLERLRRISRQSSQ